MRKKRRQVRPTFTLAQVLKETKQLYQLFFRIVFPLAFVFALVKQVAGYYLQQSVVISEKTIQIVDPAVVIGASLITLVVSIIISAVIQAHVSNAYQLNKVSSKQIWAWVLHLLPRLLLGGIVAYVMIAIGISLYVLPGVLLFALLFIYQPLILFGQQTVISAIRISIQWTSKHYLSVLTVVVTYLLLLYLPNVFINFFITQTDNTTIFGIDEVAAIFINALIFPILCIFPVVVFQQIRKLDHPKDAPKSRPSKKR